MRPEKHHRISIKGVIKDTLIIALVFAALHFIDVRLASFIAIICTVIILNRRVILDYNPGFITGHTISYKQKEIVVPKEVDVFDLSNVPAIEHLCCYTKVIRSILVPPAVLIIRFCGILQLEEYDLFLLTEIIQQLQKSDIAVIFSDAGKNVRLQFREFGIDKILGDENICTNASEALAQADKVLHKTRIK